MIDLVTSPKGRLAAAALKLAEAKPWPDVSLLDIADQAGMTLDEVRKVAGSKGQVLVGFMRAVDDEVLKRAPTKVADGARRDALFEVIMSRFDVLAPYKPALKSIARAAPGDVTMLMPYLNAQRWMLAAAGIDADGPSGLIRTGGLGALYAAVLRVWLEDDDPGLARTMAALDRRLRRSESTIRTIDGVAAGAGRLITDLPGVIGETLGRVLRPRSRDATTSPATPDNPPTTGGQP